MEEGEFISNFRQRGKGCFKQCLKALAIEAPEVLIELIKNGNAEYSFTTGLC